MTCKPALTVTEGNGYPVNADPALEGMLEAMSVQNKSTREAARQAQIEDKEALKKRLYAQTKKHISYLTRNSISIKNGYPKYTIGVAHPCEKCGKPVLTGLAKCSKCKTGRTARQNKDIVDRNDFAQLNRSGSRKSTQKENK